jgi:hypothetical protein
VEINAEGVLELVAAGAGRDETKEFYNFRKSFNPLTHVVCRDRRDSLEPPAEEEEQSDVVHEDSSEEDDGEDQGEVRRYQKRGRISGQLEIHRTVEMSYAETNITTTQNSGSRSSFCVGNSSSSSNSSRNRNTNNRNRNDNSNSSSDASGSSTSNVVSDGSISSSSRCSSSGSSGVPDITGRRGVEDAAQNYDVAGDLEQLNSRAAEGFCMGEWVTERFADVTDVQSMMPSGQRTRQVELQDPEEYVARRSEVTEVLRDMVPGIVDNSERLRVMRKNKAAWLSRQRQKRKRKRMRQG